ncbi:MAG: hypothetical protein ACMXYD_03710 [Candidatus Woesearchaeota archaeon]
MDVKELFINSCKSALTVQNKNGSFQPGTNGPYNHEDTLVTNTARQSISFYKAYSMTGNKKFFVAGNKCMDSLLTKMNCPFGFTYKIRNTGFDKCNGVIGQAIVIQALSFAYKVSNETKYLEEALRLFNLLPFNKATNLWERIEIDGTNLGVDNTFNHQLAFVAYTIPLAQENKKVRNKLKLFLDNVENNLVLRNKKGLIRHFSKQKILGEIKYFLLNKYFRLADKLSNYEYKERGYHAYNMLLFAKLKQEFPDHNFWESNKYQRAREYFISKEYEQIKETSNPFFEKADLFLAYHYHKVENNHKKTKFYLQKYLEEHYDFEKMSMSKNSADPDSSQALVYLLADFLDLDL